MRTTIDKAGRIVIPKEIRDQVGLTAGPVDIHVFGNTVQIEVPVETATIIERDGRPAIAGGISMTADELRELRMLLQDPMSGRGEPDA